MNWGYLSEFWNSVSSTTINAWEYSQEWFYNIGNAVAGAIGSLFDFVNHYIDDFFCFINWFAHNLGFILSQLLAPVKYIFTFSSSFFENSFTTPILPEEFGGFSTTTLNFINSLPYWNLVGIALGVMLLFIVGLAILNLFLKT